MVNGFMPGQGQGVGMPRRGLGGFDKCRCPNCGLEVEKARNLPCNRMTCPQCGAQLIGN